MLDLTNAQAATAAPRAREIAPGAKRTKLPGGLVLRLNYCPDGWTRAGKYAAFKMSDFEKKRFAQAQLDFARTLKKRV